MVEKWIKMTLCAGKVMDAADSINGAIRKMKKEKMRTKQNKPSRQAGRVADLRGPVWADLCA